MPKGDGSGAPRPKNDGAPTALPTRAIPDCFRSPANSFGHRGGRIPSRVLTFTQILETSALSALIRGLKSSFDTFLRNFDLMGNHRRGTSLICCRIRLGFGYSMPLAGASAFKKSSVSSGRRPSQDLEALAKLEAIEEKRT